MMHPLATSLIVASCTFAAALLGMFLQRRLPKQHVASESKEVVRLAMGLVASTVALILGLLVYSSKTFYDTQTAEVTQLSTNVVLLDRLLAYYGPEAANARAELRRSIGRQIDVMWAENSSHQPGIQTNSPSGESVVEKIDELAPKDDRQKAVQTQARSLAFQTGQTRLLIYEQRSVPVPKPLMAILVFWLFALFVSFGLFAPSNMTVAASLLIAALAVCGAVFLIVEMYYPYGGLIQVSSAPLKAALAQLGQ